MEKNYHFNFSLNFLYSLLKLFFIVLFFLTLSRVSLFLSYESFSNFELSEVFSAFLLGFRLDASLMAYIFAPPVLVSFFVWLFRVKFLHRFLYPVFRFYFTTVFNLIVFLYLTDYAYFSFFGEHSTLMIFGVFDDDTSALIQTALKNYNVTLVGFVVFVLLVLNYVVVKKVLKQEDRLKSEFGFLKQIAFFLFVILLTAITIRGSFGLFPLAYNTPDPTPQQFLNKISKNPVFALVDSYVAYEKSKNGNYDLIKQMGYKGHIKDAFALHVGKKIDEKNLLKNINYTTKQNLHVEKNPPHVVVVMVESFGMPILSYQSKEFDIMGHLQKHFKEDTVFKHFISASNGTIASLEPVLLNITARPKSTPFGQGKYLNTSFYEASAKVYQKAGYETTFVYGGDLSWRNVGNFLKRQGFDNVEGKKKIAKTLGKNVEDISHDWGVFDEYLHKYVEQKLKNAKKPQFIFVLTTNNHPPYTVPKGYKSHSLVFSKELKKHLTGDIKLAYKRFRDYAYALDSLGVFLDNIKNSNLANNTVVAITADNNTVEGIMKYDDYYNTTKLIPFYLYLPPYLKQNIDEDVPSSHKDLFPTLYNLTLSGVNYTAIGTNLLDKTKLHCGFNDDGVIISKDGAFKFGKAKSEAQKECQDYYKATLSVTEYLIKHQKGR